MPDTRGTLNLAVPAVVSNALLRKISADCSYRRPHGRTRRASGFRRSCWIAPSQWNYASLIPSCHCRPWRTRSRQTAVVSRSASAPAVLLVDEIRLGLATPVRVNSRRAARVLSLEPPKRYRR